MKLMLCFLMQDHKMYIIQARENIVTKEADISKVAFESNQNCVFSISILSSCTHCDLHERSIVVVVVPPREREQSLSQSLNSDKRKKRLKFNATKQSVYIMSDATSWSRSYSLSIYYNHQLTRQQPWLLIERLVSKCSLFYLGLVCSTQIIHVIALNTGAEMPLVGLGTWLSKPDEVRKAVKYALETGYRHLDCAYVYCNEDEVGQGIRESGVPRSEIFITSKVWYANKDRMYMYILRYSISSQHLVFIKLWNTHHRKEYVKSAVKASLEALGLDYLDLYLIHWPVSFIVSVRERKDSIAKQVDWHLLLYTRTQASLKILLLCLPWITWFLKSKCFILDTGPDLSWLTHPLFLTWPIEMASFKSKR